MSDEKKGPVLGDDADDAALERLEKRISRRKLLAAFGMASAAIATQRVISPSLTAYGKAETSVTEAVYGNPDCDCQQLQADLAGPNGARLVGFIQDGVGAVATTLQEKARERVTPFDFGAKGDRVTDDTVSLQAFFNYIATHPIALADWSGDFLISADLISATGQNVNPKTGQTYARTFTGHMTLISNYSSTGYLLTLSGYWQTAFEGKLTLLGLGTSTYNTRKNWNGLKIFNSSMFTFSEIECWYFKRNGVEILGTSTEFNIGTITARYCGAAAPSGGLPNLQATVTGYNHTGLSAVPSQISEVSCSNIPDELNVGDFLLYYNSTQKVSEAKYIKSIDRVSGKVNVSPWVTTDEEAYTPYYVIGSGVYKIGVDTSAGNIGLARTLCCACGVKDESLYPVSISKLVTQFNGVGMSVGNQTDGASQGGVCLSAYFEANGVDFLACSVNATYSVISALPNADQWKLKASRAVVLTGSFRNYNHGTTPVAIGSNLGLNYRGYQNGLGVSTYRPVLETGRPTSQTKVVAQTTGGASAFGIIKLKYNKTLNQLFGHDTIEIFLHGTLADGSIPGVVTFEADDAVSLVNGVASLAVAVTGPTLFVCRYIGGTWRVFKMSGSVA